MHLSRQRPLLSERAPQIENFSALGKWVFFSKKFFAHIFVRNELYAILRSFLKIQIIFLEMSKKVNFSFFKGQKKLRPKSRSKNQVSSQCWERQVLRSKFAHQLKNDILFARRSLPTEIQTFCDSLPKQLQRASRK